MMAPNETLPLLENDQATQQKASFPAFLVRFWPTGFVGFGGPQARTFIVPKMRRSKRT